MSYHVFHRTWWKRNKNYPGGREPSIGRKTTIARVDTEAEALSIAKVWNANHEPGFLSRKAEFQSG